MMVILSCTKNCEFRLGDDTYLFSTSSSFQTSDTVYLILDLIVSFVMHISESYRCSPGGSMNVQLKELEMTHHGLFYIAHTQSCSNIQSWPFSASTNVHGNNIVLVWQTKTSSVSVY